MGDLVEAQARHDAELRVRKAEEWLQADLDQREERAEDGDDGDGEDGLVGLGPDGARNAHDGRRAANAAAAGRQQGERVLDLEEAGDEVIERDHDGDDDDGGLKALEAGTHEDDEVELEA